MQYIYIYKYIISTGMHFWKWILKGMKFYEDSIKCKRSVLSGLFGWCVAAPSVSPFISPVGLVSCCFPAMLQVRNSNALLWKNAVRHPFESENYQYVFSILQIHSSVTSSSAVNKGTHFKVALILKKTTLCSIKNVV